MRSMKNVVVFTAIVTLTSLSSTGCLSIAESLLFGADGDRGPQVPVAGSANADCHAAKDACESFVVAVCDRIEQCGVESFDDCVNDLVVNGHFPCDRAEAIQGSSAQCEDDLAAVSCTEVQNGNFPASCDAFALKFGDAECR